MKLLILDVPNDIYRIEFAYEVGHSQSNTDHFFRNASGMKTNHENSCST